MIECSGSGPSTKGGLIVEFKPGPCCLPYNDEDTNGSGWGLGRFGLLSYIAY